MNMLHNASNNKKKDISLSVINNYEFPDGCGGCPGVCCMTICGEPPDIMPRVGPIKVCRELTPEGLCAIQLRTGYDSKPDICKRLLVGGDECLCARKVAEL